AQLLALDYKGRDFGFLVALPKTGKTPKALARQLSAASWAGWLAKLEKTPVALSMPRFKLEESPEIKDALHALGVRTPFTGEADFDPMAPNAHLALSGILQKVVVEVTETGTKAAAATATAMITGMAPQRQKPVPFVADRPFFFAIYHQKTGLVLFAGLLERP